MRDEFILAACVPRANHASGSLEEADSILAGCPGVAEGDINAAAVLGDWEGVQRLLSEDRGRATTRGGPYGWDALTYLCFSQYLRLRASDGFVRAAEILLEAGADANTGFFETEHEPQPGFESVLYGAAGVAHHPGLTRLLLAHGADPNVAGEVAYHAPEGFDNEAMELVVQSGLLASDGLTTMLHRKLDWTDLGGVRWLLDHGADPNALSAWGDRALQHSLARDNALRLIEALLDSGGDPTLPAPRHDGRSAVSLAAYVGRADALELFQRRGFAIDLDGDDAFFAALARREHDAARAFLEADRQLVERLVSERPAIVTTLAGAGNTGAVALALELGFPLTADALAVAVWRERTDTVRLLLNHGAPVTASVLALALRATTEPSEWTPHRSGEIIDALEAPARLLPPAEHD